MNPNPIRQAATLILWRSCEEGPEIYLIKRHHKSGFMGNAHVFPGGRLDESDLAAAAQIPGDLQIKAKRQVPLASDALTATALSLAALRETAEESGIFLCGADGEHRLTVKEQEQAQADRDAGLDFYEILQRRNWKPNLNSLKTVAWWLTPPVEPKRYNTVFFAAEIRGAVSDRADARETHGGAWWPVRSFFESYGKNELFLAPPTFAVMEDVAQASDFNEFVTQSNPNQVICPDLEIQPDGTVLFRLIGHPAHPDFCGEPPLGRRIGLRLIPGGQLHSLWQE